MHVILFVLLFPAFLFSGDFLLDAGKSSGLSRYDMYRMAAKDLKFSFALADAYGLMQFQGYLSFGTAREFSRWACADAKAQGFACSYGAGLLFVRAVDSLPSPPAASGPEITSSVTIKDSDTGRVVYSEINGKVVRQEVFANEKAK